MKRGFKKISGMLFAIVMILAMATVALADNPTVTVVNNLSDHTFKAYAIFTGTYDSASKALTDVDWGDGVNSSTLLTNLTTNAGDIVLVEADTTSTPPVTEVKLSDKITTGSSAADVAKVLADYDKNEDLVNAFVEAAYAAKKDDTSDDKGITIEAGTTTSLAFGYYLIVDTTNDVTSTTVKAYNNALLQVVGTEVTIAQKTDAPTVEKKVEEIGYSETDSKYVSQYNDVADYSIGDTINYELIGTIPDADYLKYYSYYKYTFTDTLSVGLDANTGSVTVYLATDKSNKTNWVAVPITYGEDPDKVINYTVGYASDTTGTYTDGHVLTVSFTDILSLVNLSGTAIDVSDYNYIIVEYTATLNSSAVIGLDGNPNEVYLTYSSNPNSVTANDDDTKDTPKDKVIVFTYELDVTKVDASSTSTKLANAQFVLYRMSGSDKEYVKVDSSNKVTGWTKTESEASVLTSDSNGLFKVIGLEDDTYYLHEKVAPTGYNLLSSDIMLKIEATTANNQSWGGTASNALTKLEITVGTGSATEGNTQTGVVAATVENVKGTNLPTTGGIGTTIFYIVGGILVVGAGVILITRRRMNRD